MKKKCSFCKHELDFFTKECPYCYETQKIPRFIYISLIIFVLFSLIVGIFIGINS